MVPSFRRPDALHRLLTGIAQLDFPPSQFEVIVVDDSGEDILESVVEAHRGKLCIQLFRTAHVGPAPARQCGIDAARGRYLAFTDDDCVPAREWLKRMLDALWANPGAAVGGPVVNGLPENPYSATTQMLTDYLIEQWNRAEVRYLATANIAFPAEEFQRIGGLDRTWNLWGGEDRDLCRRWTEAGHPIIYDPGMKIVHYHGMTLGSFWDQHFRYGRGARRVHRRSDFQSIVFYRGLIARGFRGNAEHSGLVIGALVLLTQAATLCGLAWEAVQPTPERGLASKTA